MNGHFRVRGSLARKRLAITAGVLCVATVAFGFLRNHYSDREVVSRAELIVVGAMQEGSLTFHGRSSIEGWEHHLRLSISEVVKGTVFSNSIAVSIDGGLTPLVGGYHSNRFGTLYDYRRPGYPAEMVQIYDTGSSSKPSRSISGDIRTNHIWLLRYDPPLNTNKPPSVPPQIIGIHDPEDIQPISRREQLMKYLK